MERGITPYAGIFRAVVSWQVVHGRHGLPWQATQDPYRVWLSEIMLQQTQVITVMRYYVPFLERFPDVHALGQADVEAVFSSWSGLGYYTRARNLHRCAQQVVSAHGGRFPTRSADLAELPGIGPSTAAAVAAFCFGERVSIFDGNVKRVLARVLGFDQDLSGVAASRALNEAAQALVAVDASGTEMARYTQGLMDLGATVCTRSRPRCGECPLSLTCIAQAQGRQNVLPLKTRRIARKTVALWFLVAQRPDGSVCLMKRPDQGIWSSLWCFPAFSDRVSLLAALGVDAAEWVTDWPAVSHALTHRELVLTAVVCRVASNWEPGSCPDQGPTQWLMPGTIPQGGVPVPVSKWLESLVASRTTDS